MPTFNAVWANIIRCQGEVFHTITGLPLTYSLSEGKAYFTIDREGKKIRQMFYKKLIAQACERIPIKGLSDVADLRGPSYLYAILTDRRIVK
jgi:hypothetical protein